MIYPPLKRDILIFISSEVFLVVFIFLFIYLYYAHVFYYFWLSSFHLPHTVVQQELFSTETFIEITMN